MLDSNDEHNQATQKRREDASPPVAALSQHQWPTFNFQVSRRHFFSVPCHAFVLLPPGLIAISPWKPSAVYPVLRLKLGAPKKRQPGIGIDFYGDTFAALTPIVDMENKKSTRGKGGCFFACAALLSVTPPNTEDQPFKQRRRPRHARSSTIRIDNTYYVYKASSKGTEDHRRPSNRKYGDSLRQEPQNQT